jgi:uncharacterized membrane protein YoaK (UPF0700 family)
MTVWPTILAREHDRDWPLPPFLLALTLVTGLIDAFSYLVLGHVFVANMTGNVVFLAFALAGAPGFSIAASLLALLAFLGGAAIGGRLARVLGTDRSRLLGRVAMVEATLFGAAAVATVASDPGLEFGRDVLIVLLAVAMGMQNAAARRLAVPDLTTTVLTLTSPGSRPTAGLAPAATRDSDAGPSPCSRCSAARSSEPRLS